MNVYQKFSKIYDKLMYDCDYEKWSQYLLYHIKNAKSENIRGCDVACGSGNITTLLKKGGVDVFGVDISEQMLQVAAEKSRHMAMKINYILADGSEFTSPHKLDFVTMCLAGVNYVQQCEIEKLFQNIFNNLTDDGLFFFDISSSYKLLEFIAENIFYDDSDEVTYLWTNELADDDSFVDYEIAFFVKENEVYHRFDEKHRLFVHHREELERILKKVGFSSVEVCFDDFDTIQSDENMRLHFIVKK